MWAAWHLREPQKQPKSKAVGEGIQSLPTARAVPGKPSRCPQHPRDEEQGTEPAGRAAARGWQPSPQAPPNAPRKVLGPSARGLISAERGPKSFGLRELYVQGERLQQPPPRPQAQTQAVATLAVEKLEIVLISSLFPSSTTSVGPFQGIPRWSRDGGSRKLLLSNTSSSLNNRFEFWLPPEAKRSRGVGLQSPGLALVLQKKGLG